MDNGIQEIQDQERPIESEVPASQKLPENPTVQNVNELDADALAQIRDEVKKLEEGLDPGELKSYGQSAEPQAAGDPIGLSFKEQKALRNQEEKDEYEKLEELSFSDLPEGFGFRTREQARKAYDGHLARALTELDWLETASMDEIPKIELKVLGEIARINPEEAISIVNSGRDLSGDQAKAVIAKALSSLAEEYPQLMLIEGGQYLHLEVSVIGDLETALKAEIGYSKPRPAIAMIRLVDLVEELRSGSVERVGPGGEPGVAGILIYPEDALKEKMVYRKAPPDAKAFSQAAEARAINV